MSISRRLSFANILVILTSITFLLPYYSYAQNEGRWYSVEVLIFKHLKASSLGDEFWPQDLTLTYPNSLQYLTKERIDNPLLKKDFTRLDRSLFSLNNHRESLRRSANYEVLFHDAWQQQMWGKDAAVSIAIQGGDTIDNDALQEHSELEGFITFHISRFLHVNTELWLSEPSIAKIQGADGVSTLPERPIGSNEASLVLTQALQRDSVPGQSLSEHLGEKLARDARRILDTTNRAIESTSQAELNTNTSQGIVALQQTRRMRSKELHYIDHPLLGMFIYFNPIPEEG